MKLYRKLHLTVIDAGKQQTPYSSYGSGSPIYKHVTIYTLRLMHRAGSTRPKGYYHDPIGRNGGVRVEWSWTEELGYYAPDVSFEPNELSLKCMALLTPHLKELGHRDGPETVLKSTQAMIVESVEDVLNERGEGAYHDYRPIMRVGDPAMVVLAYAAL